MAIEMKNARTDTGVYSAEYLRDVGVRLFRAVGAPEEEAAIVVNELVEASLMGLDSHGIMRYIWYIEEALNGNVVPGAQSSWSRRRPQRLLSIAGSTGDL